MWKLLMAMVLLFAVTTEADAARRKRQRIIVYPSQPIYQPRPIVAHPYAVDLVLSYIFCGFHVFSVGPDPKPGQLGSCASYFNYSQPKQRRRVA